MLPAVIPVMEVKDTVSLLVGATMFTVPPPPTVPREAKIIEAVPPLPGVSLTVPEPLVGVKAPSVSTLLVLA